MRVLPATAFGRSALVVALAVGLSQVLTLWFFARNAYLPGIREYARLTVLQADLALEPDTGQRPAAVRLSEATGIEIAEAGREPADDAWPLLSRPVVSRFDREVERLLDEPARVRLAGESKPVLWVTAESFDGRWVRVPMTFFRDYDRYLLLGWGVTIPLLSIAAGLLIARGLNRPLKRLERAAAFVGRGEPVPRLDDSAGPAEIDAVNRAFNRMASEMLQAQRDRALLLAGVSHDLRTPLTRMRLTAEFLDDADLSRGIIQDIEDMDAILDQFIGFIRDGADEEPGYAQLNDLIEEVRGKLDGDQIEFTPGEIPRLMVKRLTMKRLLSNLLTNGLKYGRPPVEVATELDENEVVLRVRDHGPGVRAEDIPVLLEPFSRGDAARTLSGSGLGLAIVSRIVDMHHGHMSLDNDPEGGLRVEIRLPVTGRFVQPEALSSRVR